MHERRLVGNDLGVASAHTAQVLRADGTKVCRRSCWPRMDSLQELEQAALADAPEGTRLEVVMEPTGPAWRPIAIYFIRRGHLVYRVSSAKAHDVRRFLSRHAKSNSIDALTLAMLPIVGPQGLRPLEPARQAAVLLAAGLPERSRVRDLGAGAAAWSLALVAQQPSCQVTAFDLPPVLEVTRRSVAAAGRTDRYRFLAGDAFLDELGGPYDLALIANVIHLFGEARSVELLTRVAAELRPDGRLAVIDVIPNGKEPSRRAALHDLSLLLRTHDGALHPFSSYAKWLRRAGVEPIARHRLDPGWEATLVVAGRTATSEGRPAELS